MDSLVDFSNFVEEEDYDCVWSYVPAETEETIDLRAWGICDSDSETEETDDPFRSARSDNTTMESMSCQASEVGSEEPLPSAGQSPQRPPPALTDANTPPHKARAPLPFTALIARKSLVTMGHPLLPTHDDSPLSVPAEPTTPGKLTELGLSQLGASTSVSLRERMIEQSYALLTMLARELNTINILRIPFPMSTYGTLRIHQPNNHYMGLPASDKTCMYDKEHVARDHTLGYAPKHMANRVIPQYSYWTPACVNQTYCEGLRIYWGAQARSPTEVFFFSPSQFVVALPDIDSLESFSEREVSRSSYIRTLMWVTILDWDIARQFPTSLSNKRNISALVSDKDASVRIPCWVYSSIATNSVLARRTRPGEVLIWAPHDVPRPNDPTPMPDAVEVAPGRYELLVYRQ